MRGNARKIGENKLSIKSEGRLNKDTERCNSEGKKEKIIGGTRGKSKYEGKLCIQD